MRLLVSVRSAAEVRAVLDGGGDIVDAKEPSRGPLGPVDPDVLREIGALVPSRVPLSAALGDFVAAAAAASAVADVPEMSSRRSPVLLKLGFAGMPERERIEAMLAAATSAARTRGDAAAIVAVAYADHRAARTAPPEVVLDAAASAGAAGVLVDTWAKDGRDLLHWMPRPDLEAWALRGRRAGLMTAVAGSLRGERLAAAAGCGADVVGVRGAVCQGGRGGVVLPSLVRRVRWGLAEARRPPAEVP